MENQVTFGQRILNCCREIRTYLTDIEIQEAIVALVFIIADWFIDIIVSISHAVKGNILQAILTVGIVFASGVLNIIYFYIDPGNNTYKEELRTYPCLRVLSYTTPSLLPVYSGILRVRHAFICKALGLENPRDPVRIRVYRAEFCRFKLFSRVNKWNIYFESVFEVFPQCVLQYVIILETESSQLESLWDVMPYIGILLGIFGMIRSSINLLVEEDLASGKGYRWGLKEKLIIFCGKAFGLFCIPISVVLIRQFISETLLSTIVTLCIICIIIDFPFIIEFISQFCCQENAERTFVLSAYCLCVIYYIAAFLIYGLWFYLNFNEIILSTPLIIVAIFNGTCLLIHILIFQLNIRNVPGFLIREAFLQTKPKFLVEGFLVMLGFLKRRWSERNPQRQAIEQRELEQV